MKLEPVLETDLIEILKLQKLAFQSQAIIHNVCTLPALNQTLEEIIEDFTNQIFLKATIDNKIVGSVRAYNEGGTCHIGRLIVDPDFQNQGIGTRLMNEIESIFTDVRRFELFTGYKSKKNLYLYQKLGYQQFKTDIIDDNFQRIYLEKKVRV